MFFQRGMMTVFRVLLGVSAALHLAQLAHDGQQPVAGVAALLDVLGLIVIGHRRLRLAVVAWLVFSGSVHVMAAAMHPGDHITRMLNVALATIAAVACSIPGWPRAAQAARPERLVPLSMGWAVRGALLVASADLVIALLDPTESMHNASLMLAGMTTLVVLGGMVVASSLGSLRWVMQPLVGLMVVLPLMETFRPRTDALLVHALLGVVLGWVLEWSRSARAPLQRGVRAWSPMMAGALLPLVVLSPHDVLDPWTLGVAAWRALAFSVVVAMAPSPAAARPQHLKGASMFGLPPAWLLVAWTAWWTSLWVLARFAGRSMAGGPWLLGGQAQGLDLVPAAAMCVALVSLPLVVRARWVRIVAWVASSWMSLVVVVTVVERTSHRELVPFAVAFTGILAVAWAVMLEHPTVAAHFARRHWWRARVSGRGTLALVVMGHAAVAAGMAFLVKERNLRPSDMVSAVAGVATLPVPSVVPPVLPSNAPDESRFVGSAVQWDRGTTWVVDDETDHVVAVAEDGRRRRYKVGAWPQRLIVHHDGRVFVSCRGAGRIDVIHPDGTLSSVAVGAEPMALAMSGDGRALYAGLVTERALVAVDTTTLRVMRTAALEGEPRAVAVTPEGIAVLPARAQAVTFLAPVDFSVNHVATLYAGRRQSWHGEWLLPAGRDLVVVHAVVETGLNAGAGGGGYGGDTDAPVERVVAVLRDGHSPVLASSLRGRDVGVVETTGAIVRGGRLLVVGRGSGAVQPWCGSASCPRMNEAPVRLDVGVAGLARAGDGTLRTFSAFTRQLVVLGADDRETGRVAMGKGVLDERMAEGRRLFHDATDPRIAAHSLSCATCHPDGREDGLVWQLEGTSRQTPMLAGRLAETAPYDWTGSQPTLEANIHQTVKRLGGDGLGQDERRALATFLVKGLREPAHPQLRLDEQLVERGRQVFADADVGCMECHAGRALTDGKTHDVGSVSEEERRRARAAGADAVTRFATPSLRHLGLSAPYLHDGSAASLEQLVEENHDRMGVTSDLSREDRAALVAYLRSL